MIRSLPSTRSVLLLAALELRGSDRMAIGRSDADALLTSRRGTSSPLDAGTLTALEPPAAVVGETEDAAEARRDVPVLWGVEPHAVRNSPHAVRDSPHGFSDDSHVLRRDKAESKRFRMMWS